MLRPALLALALVACLLLAVAEFLDLNSIQILTVTREGESVGGHHAYAQLVIAVGAAVMAFGAWRGARPAAVALAVLGVAALVIVVLVDAPDVSATGVIGRDYEQAEAQAEIGFRVEAAGAVLLLFAGVATLVAGSAEPRQDPPRPGPTSDS